MITKDGYAAVPWHGEKYVIIYNGQQIADVESVSFVTTANDYGGYILPRQWYERLSLEGCSSIHGPSHDAVLEDAVGQLAGTMAAAL